MKYISYFQQDYFHPNKKVLTYELIDVFECYSTEDSVELIGSFVRLSKRSYGFSISGVFNVACFLMQMQSPYIPVIDFTSFPEGSYEVFDDCGHIISISL